MKSGCVQKSFFGCAFIFLFFAVIIIILWIAAQIPDIDLSTTDTAKREYEIEVDSLSKEKVINSSFSWQFVDNTLTRRKYRINLKLLEKDVIEAMNYIDRISAMSYRELGLERNYSDPEIESRVVWAEVYRRIFLYSSPQMKAVLEGLNEIFLEEKFETRDKVYFVITFVQNIKYDRPGGTLDLFPPIGTLAYRFGDCDSKALLLYVILERMGIDCAMMWSYNYKHAMLGIRVNARGEYLVANGKKYYFLETTYPQWSIGEIPPEFGNTKFWYISEIDAGSQMNKFSDETETRKSFRPTPSIP
ncbi:MAG: transglutaminase family protein [bacterium]|nr:transglutaminase family protein [bacterium]